MVAPVAAAGTRTLGAGGRKRLAAAAAGSVRGEEGEARIGGIAWFFMTLVALIFDLLQFLVTLLAVVLAPIVLVSSLITFFFICIFTVWFAILRVNFLGGRRMGLKLGLAFASIAIELIPILNALPGMTIGITGIIIATRLEDHHKA